MANELQTIRSSIKSKLDIASADTTFDAMLLECIGQAIPRLKPFVQYQMAESTAVTLASADDSFTMPTAGSQLQKLFTRVSTNDSWRELTLWQQHRDKIYLNEYISTTTYVKILATRAYANSDADMALLMVDCPSALLPLYLFAMAEFMTYVVGNKRKFNIYQQSNGSRTVSEMRDLAEHYENRAIRILEDEISAEGQ